MLSQSAEYALRAVVALAYDPQAPLTTRQIAERTKVPAGYLSKVLQSLGRAGLVAGQRGLGGGFRLARPAGSVSILDVVNAVSPLQRIVRCPLSRADHRGELCALHQRLDRAYGQVEKALSRTTIAEVLRAPECCRPFGPPEARRAAKRAPRKRKP
ncbi:MAG: Rrf2 family transcriptional regulator [Deltaproteobacteria bacterium]|nr:Rrf2 family transcriptional regulator [Deltaproteobacteria bacterium]MBW2534725.1 Rrf2 family transcriptional regulator [Deltaproteobacteria bacterium]